jgi:hypothetical protein
MLKLCVCVSTSAGFKNSELYLNATRAVLNKGTTVESHLSKTESTSIMNFLMIRTNDQFQEGQPLFWLWTPRRVPLEFVASGALPTLCQGVLVDTVQTRR